MKKVSVIGAGSAGLLSAINCFYNFIGNNEWEVELVHDPNIPPEKVGQGTVPGIVDLLHRVFDIDWKNNPINATPKTGIMYKNWGKKNKEFLHPFPMNFLAIHYNVKDLREYVLNSKKINIVEKNIQNYEDIDSDFIIDCSGKPNILEDYTILKNPINSVILGKCEGKDDNLLWTDCIATPDGWCFRIPNPDSISYGYLYNDNITETSEAKINFQNMFDTEVGDSFSFLNYFSNNFIIDNRVFLNGNKLVFLEPLEANSNAIYMQASNLYIQYMFNQITKKDLILDLKLYVKRVQNYLLWHYKTGSIYDTEFWDYASSFDFSDLEFKNFYSKAKDKSMQEIWRYMDNLSNPPSYAQWYLPSFKNWIENT